MMPAGIDAVIRDEYRRLSREGAHVAIPKLRDAVRRRGITSNALRLRLVALCQDSKIGLHETGARLSDGVFHGGRYYHFLTMRMAKCRECGADLDVHADESPAGGLACRRCAAVRSQKGETGK